MKITTRQDILRFEDVELYVNDVVKTLAKLPVEDLVSFLKGPQLFSRRDYATILKNVMRDEVWKFKLVSRVAEKGLAHDFYSRLDYFEDSPVTVLENLFLKMVKIQPEMIDHLLEDLWLFALQAVEGKNKALIDFYKKGEKTTTSKVVLKDLFPTIGALFADELGDIDGVLVSDFTKKGLHSATLKELREMGDRFGVPLPTSITKQDIFDAIVAVLPSVAKAKDIPAITEDLRDMTVAQLKAFVEKYKLDVPTELKKVDVGEILINNFDGTSGKNVNDNVTFNLPERIDDIKDLGEQDPKVARLTERIKELESALAKKPAVETKEKEVVKEVIKEVVNTSAVDAEKAKVEALETELEKAKAKLDEKPKEVVKEVVKEIQGPTIVRTVISKKELLKQKEKYEAIIAEQEKERALLISQTDEHDEVLAKYAEVKEQLARKEAELDEEISKNEALAMKPEDVETPVAPAAHHEAYGYSVHAKLDRLVDKVHELQLEIVRSENRRLEQALRDRRYEEEVAVEQAAVAEEEKAENDTEVNLYFDSNLAKRMVTQTEEGGRHKKVRHKRRKKRYLLRAIIWLLILTIVVFMGGWALVRFAGAPFAGPPWIADRFNGVIFFLHGIVELIFQTVIGWWNAFIGLFIRP